MDTINEVFSTRDEQDNAVTNRQFTYIRKLRNETGVSVVLMRHIGQGEQARRVYSASRASLRAARI